VIKKEVAKIFFDEANKIPMLNMDDPDFEENLDFALSTQGSSSDYRNEG